MRHSLDFPLQSRFSIAFIYISNHFITALHEFCPEEREHIIERGSELYRFFKKNNFSGLIACNAVLEELSKKTTSVLAQICTDEHQMAVSTSPQACAKIIAIACQPTVYSTYLKLFCYNYIMIFSKESAAFATRIENAWI